MGKSTDISWTDHTFNPWWGCQRVSPGCENCYAETFAKRVGQQVWGPAKTTERRIFGPKHWQEPMKWESEAKAAGVRRRVFCASMADVFESTDNPAIIASRLNLWDLIRDTPTLEWLLLTKRPENFAAMLPWRTKPWPNVWLGVSAEDQQRADERIPLLLQAPAAIRFLSCEPLLGPIELSNVSGWRGAARWLGRMNLGPDAISWVIVGGESGPKHRPFSADWARSLRDQCQAAGVAFHFKQVGGRTHAEGGCMLDGREWKEFPEPRRELIHAR
jgi:protein gp37